MVSLKTKAFKTLPNGDPLLVDIYSPPDSSKPSSKSNTIFLYYHPGGLVAYDRKLVNPHMVQACLSRGWTLVCPDYKLLPQVSGEEIWKDAADAYEFVATGKIFDNETEASKEIRIIAAGGSAGSYLAFLTAAHYAALTPPPIAVFSYYGSPNFHAPFFRSSRIVNPEPVKYSELTYIYDDKVVSTGLTAPSDAFDPTCLTPELKRNPKWVRSTEELPALAEGFKPRGWLYDYFVQENRYPVLFPDVWRDFSAVQGAAKGVARDGFPKVVMIHGDEDIDVPLELASDFEKFLKGELGDGSARLVVVKGVAHSFDDGLFLEDETPEMHAIKEAWRLLDNIVEKGEFES